MPRRLAVRNVRVVWLDDREQTYYATDSGYNAAGTVFWICTENTPDIGDRKIINIPTENVRVIEGDR
jgi:hypothetical protein